MQRAKFRCNNCMRSCHKRSIRIRNHHADQEDKNDGGHGDRGGLQYCRWCCRRLFIIVTVREHLRSVYEGSCGRDIEQQRRALGLLGRYHLLFFALLNTPSRLLSATQSSERLTKTHKISLDCSRERPDSRKQHLKATGKYYMTLNSLCKNSDSRKKLEVQDVAWGGRTAELS